MWQRRKRCKPHGVSRTDMSSKYRKRRRRKVQLRQPDVSQTPPGSIVSTAKSDESTLELFAYSQSDWIQEPVKEIGDLQKVVEKWSVTWVNLDGTGNTDAVQRLGTLFNLHELALEDIVNLHQRAKVDEYNNQLFIVLRMVNWEDDHIHQEQLCIVLGDGFVLTFQEEPGGDTLDPVRERIRRGYGQLRGAGPDYLMYSIIDAVVDAYFPVLEKLGDALEELEDEVLEKVDRLTPARILELKREIITIRRAVWPAREALNILIRDDAPYVSPHTKVYLRDCYDHVVRIIDLVETQRELCSDLMDLYLSSTSNKLNEVMRVLTMITLLFMPPTLVAGIYGMNFNTELSPFNMPELNWTYGYFFSLALMAFSAAVVWGLAQWRGSFRDNSIVEPTAADPKAAVASSPPV